MYSMLKEQPLNLDDESLYTLLCEVEHILHGRPITMVSDNPNDLDALTPNHLLKMKTCSNDVLGVFESSDNYARRRWRQIKYLTDLFWRRWSREYLPLLQKRQKWQKPRRNIAVGDIVLVAENTPRNVWPLGRVIDVYHDQKGLVRVVSVKTKVSVLQRPIDKLCLLLEADQ